MFEVIKVEKNIVALRNLGNKLICRSSKLRGVDGVLAALGESITKEAKLEVKEPVDSRTIKVLEFDIRNAKIYDVTPLTMVTETVNNPSTNRTQQKSLELKISTTKSITWINNVSLSLGVTTTFETGIPLIIKGDV